MTGTTATRQPTLTSRSFRAIGTTATVVVRDVGVADLAEHTLAAELEAIDLACSRFRADSELQMVHDNAGHSVPVGELLFEALDVALQAAERTGGAVDLTIGNAIAALGYDADLDEVRSRSVSTPRALGTVAGHAHVQLNHRDRTVRIPPRCPPRPWFDGKGAGGRPGCRTHRPDDWRRRAGQPGWRRRCRRSGAGGRLGHRHRP